MLMNHVIPENHIRVPRDAMTQFVRKAFVAAGVGEEEADFMAGVLILGDLRGVFTHGTQQTAAYTTLFRTGRLNPDARVEVVRETATSVKVDGDGGLGYRPSFKATETAVAKAKEYGVAVAMTSNHGHFGSAGHYTRVAVDAGCLGYAHSSHYRTFETGNSILGASGASPISIGVPSGREDPLIIDMASGAGSHEFFEHMPGTFFKMLGFGLVSHALGGILAGIVTQHEESARWPDVNQGAFFVVIDVAQLTDVKTYERQMDEFLAALKKMDPAPGLGEAHAPGALEAERERRWSTEGIPVGEQHRQVLQGVADELSIEPPWVSH